MSCFKNLKRECRVNSFKCPESIFDDTKLSMPKTLSPRSRWCLARCDPKKPAAPVIRMFFMLRYIVLTSVAPYNINLIHINMNKGNRDTTLEIVYKTLLERFGRPIGESPSTVGVPDERNEAGSMSTARVAHPISEDGTCAKCGMDEEGCECNEMYEGAVDELNTCDECGMYEDVCECSGYMSEGRKKKRKGPSKKTAKKILRGTKTFAQKMAKVSGWAENPGAAAAWMMHKATGKWPSQK